MMFLLFLKNNKYIYAIVSCFEHEYLLFNLTADLRFMHTYCTSIDSISSLIVNISRDGDKNSGHINPHSKMN